MHFDANELIKMLLQYLWPMVRITAVVVAVPFIGGRIIPARVRLMFALILTVVIVPTLKAFPPIDPFSFQGAVVFFQQMLIGISIGFIFQMVLQIFIMSGQIISMQSGLSFAAMVDPATGVSVPLISQIFMFILGLLFFSFNCHLLLIDTIASSFTLLPIGEQSISIKSCMEIVNFLSYVFKASLLLTLPVVFSLLLINLGFGVLARAAPQLNIFSIGFPITLTIGLVLIYLILSGFPAQAHSEFEQGFALTQHILKENVA